MNILKELESELERYESASPPMDRVKFVNHIYNEIKHEFHKNLRNVLDDEIFYYNASSSVCSRIMRKLTELEDRKEK